MKNEGPKKSRKIKIQPDWKWIVSIFGTTIGISATMSLVSNEVLEGSGLAVSFVVLIAIVLLGIVFDVIGMAVTTADEKPFHSMAAKKVPEAPTAIRMLRRADRVSSFCNDVVGDICGVVSGSASATIAAQVLAKTSFSWPQVITLAMSALVAGLTVGGKAIGKSFAVNSSTKIVSFVGRLLYSIQNLTKIFCAKKKKK